MIFWLTLQIIFFFILKAVGDCRSAVMIDFETFLSRTLSRKEIVSFAEEVDATPERLSELLALLDHPNRQLAWHAAWALEKLFEKYPEHFQQNILNHLSDKIINTNNESIRRLLLNIISFANLPDDLPIALINSCFEWILFVKTPIAVKVASIYYLQRVCQRELELMTELKLCVQLLLENDSSPAICSVARMII